MSELGDLLAGLGGRIAELERRVAQTDRYGTISHRRIKNGQVEVRARIGTGTNGEDVLSAWTPWKQQAGAVKVQLSPTVGQQVRLHAPNGDPRQAAAEPYTWSTANAPPSQDLDDNVITVGNVKIEFRDGKLKMTVGEASMEMTNSGVKTKVGGVTHEHTSSGLKTTGGTITHDSKNIGKDHKHGGVEPGGALTADPA